MIFQINRCKSTIPDFCANESDIDKFISRIQVETWNNFYKTDFTNLEADHSIHRIEKYISSEVLTPNHV